MRQAIKNVTGYLAFVAYLSLAGMLYLYLNQPPSRQFLCGGTHQILSASPHEEGRTPPILLRPVDEFYKPHPEASDEGGSSKSPRMVYC